MTWLVILVWLAATVFSAWYLAKIAKSLGTKANQLAKAAEPLSSTVAHLAKVAATKPMVEPVDDNILDSPLELGKVVLSQQLARKKRAAERQRRLIERLR